MYHCNNGKLLIRKPKYKRDKTMNKTKDKKWLIAIVPCVVTSILAVFILSYSSADEFDSFVKEKQEGANQLSKEFTMYSNEVDKEYKIFKEIIHQEYEKYKKNILEHWQVAKITDKKRWIEYTPDFKKRKIVDFENAFIELDLIVSKNENNFEETFKTLLTDLILEDKHTAFKRDTLSQGIEKRINNDVRQTKSGKVEKTPILATVITGSPDPSKKELEKAILNLRKNGKIKRKPSKVKDSEVVTLKIPLPSNFIQKKAKEYKPDVDYFANKCEIDNALVFAVIHTESAFNPMARSHVPAYGLMQIVPQSAGIDASEAIFGKKILLSPSYLYNGKNNINIGTTYIFIIFSRYLKKINNPKSRLYCTIAAYNTGVGNVAKAFTGTKNINKAKDVINSMSPKEVYDTLLQQLPYEETKHYLRKVSQRLDMYSGI